MPSKSLVVSPALPTPISLRHLTCPSRPQAASFQDDAYREVHLPKQPSKQQHPSLLPARAHEFHGSSNLHPIFLPFLAEVGWTRD